MASTFVTGSLIMYITTCIYYHTMKANDDPNFKPPNEWGRIPVGLPTQGNKQELHAPPLPPAGVLGVPLILHWNFKAAKSVNVNQYFYYIL